jgi:hypothetical protein
MCCLGYEHREMPRDTTAPPSSDEALVTVTVEPAENNLMTVDSATISEGPGTVLPGDSSQGDTINKEKPKDTRGRPSQPQEKTPEGQRRFKRDRRWKKKPRPEKAPAESTPGKPPQAPPADAAAQPESKGKGKPFNRRRKFWKKKQN